MLETGGAILPVFFEAEEKNYRSRIESLEVHARPALNVTDISSRAQNTEP
jgi:hypothetical protein